MDSLLVLEVRKLVYLSWLVAVRINCEVVIVLHVVDVGPGIKKGILPKDVERQVDLIEGVPDAQRIL